jgi:hypothetical protein
MQVTSFANDNQSEGGPRGLRADIGSLKRFRLVRVNLAKKFSGS